MRKLILDLFDFVRTGRRLPHCALCDSRYNDAKPFVEGSTGALVCLGCIRRIRSEEGVPVEVYLASRRLLDRASSDNPYDPPTSEPIEITCLLCGEVLERCVVDHKVRAAFCAACIDHCETLTRSNDGD